MGVSQIVPPISWPLNKRKNNENDEISHGLFDERFSMSAIPGSKVCAGYLFLLLGGFCREKIGQLCAKIQRLILKFGAIPDWIFGLWLY